MVDHEGSKAPLKTSSQKIPYAVPGAASVEHMGSTAPLKTTPVAPSSAWQDTGNPIEHMGSTANLNKTPRKGFGGDGNVSDRTKAQSK